MTRSSSAVALRIVPRPAALRGCLEACRRLDAVSRLIESAGDPSLLREAGPHLRHALEHVMGLVEGLATGCVDHAARRRDRRLEREPRAFRAALLEAERGLARLEGAELSARLDAVDVVSPGGERVRMGSTVERELAFVASHAVHHLAIVGARLEAAGLSLPSDLVLNYSTAQHLRETSA